MKLRGPLSFGWRVRVGTTAVVLPVLVQVVPLNRLTRWLGRGASGADVDPDLAASWIDGLLHRLPGPWRHTCLRRCLVLYHVLRRQGTPVELCVGVRRGEGQELAAHAWLELGGEHFLEQSSGEEREFVVIARFPEGQNNRDTGTAGTARRHGTGDGVVK